MKYDFLEITQIITKSKIKHKLIYIFSWQFNPLSKTIGGFRNKSNACIDRNLNNHDFTGRLRDSGYSNNHLTCDKRGWTPEKVLNSDQKRTEYRLQYNVKKEIHYKGPIISTGKLKKKEKVYRFT